MNSVNYKFNPGEKVFAVNRYPIGARIFEGIITKVFITVSPFQDRERAATQTIKISYRISSMPLREFAESEVVETIEEAQKIKNDWVEKIRNGKQQ